MNATQRFLSATFCLLLAIAVQAQTFTIDYGSNNSYYKGKITFKVISTTNLTCQLGDGTNYAFKDEQPAGNHMVPKTASYNGKTYTVTTIASQAYRNSSAFTNITSVTVKENIIHIDPTSRMSFGLSDVTLMVDVRNPVYDSRDNCNAIIETATNRLVVGTKKTVIPESVTIIGKQAFMSAYNSGEQYVYDAINLPDNITTIEEEAFRSCRYATIEKLPSNLKTIGASAFYNMNGIKSLEIPEGVTYIGESSFEGCFGLTDLTLPSSLVSIGKEAFKGCKKLTSITSYIKEPYDISSDVFENYDEVFMSTIPLYVPYGTKEKYKKCDGWKYFSNIIEMKPEGQETSFTTKTAEGVDMSFKVISEDDKTCQVGLGIENSWNNAINWSVAGKITIPSVANGYTVTRIGDYAFYMCNDLTSVTIPEGVTSIGAHAFSLCGSLTSITIPSSVSSIGYESFPGCSSLASVVVDTNNPIYDSRNNCNAIIETATNTLVVGCSNTVIPDGITSIGATAFEGCSLTSLTIPNSVTSIGEAAFVACSIKKIRLPSKLEIIGSHAFYGAAQLEEITIPANVTEIGDGAFAYCTGLKSIISLMETPFDLSEEPSSESGMTIFDKCDLWNQGEIQEV